MEPCYGLVNAIGRGALSALGVDVRIHGLEHVPRSGPVLLASTHGSFLDFVILERAAVERRRYVRFLTRHDVWAPVVSIAMNAMRHVPVDREAPAAAYLAAQELLRSGEAVGVFPEAGLSLSFTVRSLMRGTAALARESGAPVVPVALWGAQRISTAGDPTIPPDLTRGRAVDVSIGAPFLVPPEGDVTSWTAHLGDVLTGMLEELQLLPHHRPRPGEYAAWYPAHLGGQAPTRTRAAELEVLPLNALQPTWGPTPGVDPPRTQDADPAPADARGVQ